MIICRRFSVLVPLPSSDNGNYRIELCSILIRSSEDTGCGTRQTIHQHSHLFSHVFSILHWSQTHQRILHVCCGIDGTHSIDGEIIADDVLDNRFQLSFQSIIKRIDGQSKHHRSIGVAQIEIVIHGRSSNAIDARREQLLGLFLQQIVDGPDFHLFRVNISFEDLFQDGVDG